MIYLIILLSFSGINTEFVENINTRNILLEIYQELNAFIESDIWGLGGQDMESLFLKIADLGPNVLPHLALMIREEKNHNLRCRLGHCFEFISRFKPYIFSPDPLPEGLPEYRKIYDQNLDDLPELSLPSIKGGAYGWNDVRVNKLLDWWDITSDFSSKGLGIIIIRDICGVTPNDFANYDWGKFRLFEKKIKIYGIFNLPYYFQSIAEDNNPIVFTDFLIQYKIELYRKLEPTENHPNNVLLAQNEYPTREDKLKIVCEWWIDEKNKFSELKDLYESINTSYSQYCK